MLFRSVFSLTLKTSWKAMPGFMWRRKDRPECWKKQPVSGKCHKAGTGDDTEINVDTWCTWLSYWCGNIAEPTIHVKIHFFYVSDNSFLTLIILFGMVNLTKQACLTLCLFLLLFQFKSSQSCVQDGAQVPNQSVQFLLNHLCNIILQVYCHELSLIICRPNLILWLLMFHS